MTNPLNDDASQHDAAQTSESERVVKTYAKVLEQKTGAIVSELSLPFPKPIIKAALKAETLKAGNARFSTMAGACFRQLAGFRSEADVAVWRVAAAQESATDALAQSENGRALERAWREELDTLDQEWQRYLNEQGLA